MKSGGDALPLVLPDGPVLTALEPGRTYVLCAPDLSPADVDRVRDAWQDAWPKDEPHPRLLILVNATLEELDDAALEAAGLARKEQAA